MVAMRLMKSVTRGCTLDKESQGATPEKRPLKRGWVGACAITWRNGH